MSSPMPTDAQSNLTTAQLCGVDSGHVQSVPGEASPLIRLQPAVVQAYQRMQAAAADAGITLRIASGFRSFERQAAIWASKFDQLRPPITADELHKVLRWSALPGLSRHHWGTEFDCYDPVALRGESLQLEPWEYASSGPMAELFNWLSTHAHSFGFYRPYLSDDGPGVAAEPWHWSFAPLASLYQHHYDKPQAILDALEVHYRDFDVAGREHLNHQLESLVERYMGSVATIPEAALGAASRGT
ncbi:M15 family metallopeptidase [Aliidiomarina indica]|uniref:M15 family metallopeptidase n=1 Tax=Aliidiomarina indica TaxID=2749147 RepID=UPI001890593D|nr:M15 family metallopeptidase [Aliidiomarina indica]